MVERDAWPPRERLRNVLRRSGVSLRGAALEMGVTHAALSMILSGKTKLPQDRTARRIIEWTEYMERAMGIQGPPLEEYMSPRPAFERSMGFMFDEMHQRPANKTPDAFDNLLLGIAENEEYLWQMLETTTAHQPPSERRRIALGVLGSIKAKLQHWGLAIPQSLWSVEQRLYAGEDL